MRRLNWTLFCLAAVVGAYGGQSAFGQGANPNLARDLAATCANCHGTGGVSSGEVPSLAGQPKEELIRKMQAFKTGSAPPSTIMPQLAKGFTDQQIELVAGWFASQKPGSK